MTVKRLGQALLFTIVAVIMSAAFTISACAAAQAEISAPKDISAGKDFSVSIKVTAGENIGSVTGMLSYDDSIVKFKSSDYASGGGGVLNLNGFPDNPSKSLTLTLNFTAIQSGTCQMNLANCFLTSAEGTQIGSPTASANISVAASDNSKANDSSELNSNGDPKKGYLTNLTVSVGTLKPAFSYDIYDYHVDVENNVVKCEIEGTTANSTDRIWYTGNEELFEGDNVRTIKVTDTDDNYHVYTITITRAKTQNLSSVESAETNSTQTISSTADKDKSDSSALNRTSESGMDKYKKILTPALIIILIALIIALIAIVTWLRKKTAEQNLKKTSPQRKNTQNSNYRNKNNKKR